MKQSYLAKTVTFTVCTFFSLIILANAVTSTRNANDTSYQNATANTEQGSQSFFIQSNRSSSLRNIRQSDKFLCEGNVAGFAGKQQEPIPVIYTNLLIPQGNTMALTDGVGSAFGDRFSAAVDGDDAQKLWNFDENIALVRGTSTLAIEFRPIPALTDTLFYRLYLRQQPYTLQIFTKDFEAIPLMRAWIIDKYLNTKTEINLHDTTLYNFTPNPDTMSYRNRFMLVINRQLLTAPVPVSKTTNQENPNITGVANSMAAGRAGISVYPNPVGRGGKAMLRFSNMKAGNYTITIYSAKGQKLSNYAITHNAGDNTYPLIPGGGWVTGMYTITVYNENLYEAINLKLIAGK